MAHLWGSVQGSKGAAERGAGKDGHLTLKALSSQSRIEMLVYDKDGVDWIRLDYTPLRSGDTPRKIYEGPVRDMPVSEWKPF